MSVTVLSGMINIEPVMGVFNRSDLETTTGQDTQQSHDQRCLTLILKPGNAKNTHSPIIRPGGADSGALETDTT